MEPGGNYARRRRPGQRFDVPHPSWVPRHGVVARGHGPAFGFIEDTLRIIGQPQTVVDLPHAPAIRPRGGAIEFRKVSFTYGTQVDAIHNLNLSIPPGQKVGIVGPSGAGKSTFVHLLQRLYDVQGGEILIDGQPIASVTQDSLREALAVVPQEILLFHRTVLENIRFARSEATDEEVYAAARAAHCEAFIARLPQGYDTLVGERGVKLSGGQRQRIGIARAFLKAAPVIVLDEATSALDTESELVIQSSLVKMFRDRTVIGSPIAFRRCPASIVFWLWMKAAW
ncbi:MULTISPECIES: ABC transporter ATP-binding protein [unclassified Mesorhizobium]|uniref:ABC transporter ATP-binding protein n=1 Tax=unclassified Mesorhizobium TaxID=325217 RepID=UPI001CC9324D|nr:MULTISPECIES: ATP-binding cassette domain-containing protein [unclassified Mesorhizobium]MBZ9739975.1 ATP-binding cassette domain-containing protein [Mesorhizobium sp. CO1-1-4]MBZ9806146.1 ATP-binding cassette domain-containing protein [Mesorhizobium sp. ES1-6]